MNPTNFLTELKRRNVYRAAVAYGVVAWFLTQLTTQVFPFFEIPNSAVRFVVIALAVGFPIAMLLSWIYELTPEGIVRTEDLDPVQARSVQRATGRILDFIIIGVLLLVIAMMIVGRRPFYRQTGESISQKSIAVLPFENRSEDKANAYFADGVQDEILTDLAKIADLKVISRTSVVQYKSGVARNLREIAQQLGVANVVEGSVQRSGNRVRVNAQLVDARTDPSLGADLRSRSGRCLRHSERNRRENRRAVAGALVTGRAGRDRASADERSRRERSLCARPSSRRSGRTSRGKESSVQAISLLEEAVRRDPNFLLAYCLLCEANLDLYWQAYDHTPERRERADAALRQAERIQPDAGEVHMQKGVYAYHGFRDYERARTEFELARRTLPNDARLYLNLGSRGPPPGALERCGPGFRSRDGVGPAQCRDPRSSRRDFHRAASL